VKQGERSWSLTSWGSHTSYNIVWRTYRVLTLNALVWVWLTLALLSLSRWIRTFWGRRGMSVEHCGGGGAWANIRKEYGAVIRVWLRSLVHRIIMKAQGSSPACTSHKVHADVLHTGSTSCALRPQLYRTLAWHMTYIACTVMVWTDKALLPSFWQLC